MKSVVQHEKYGNVIYEENFWTGKKTITIDGTRLEKASKTEFLYPMMDGTFTHVKLKGNYLMGVKLDINGETVQVVESPKWYELVMYILTFVLILVWGNSPELCAIVPVLGGALGGLISAAIILAGLGLSRKVKNGLVKFLISLGTLVVTFVACFLGAMLLLSALA
ncbi:MAG: hypothetical protein IJE92_02800 [Clostridia bacterium]|nr:hypothetical protein [Clostridia bacterium]